MTHRRWTLGYAVAASVAVAACARIADETEAPVEVADATTTGESEVRVDAAIPNADAEADAPAVGRRCNVTIADSCPQGFFCGSSQDCRVGRCLPVPLQENAYEPVCGCDGVTYWNETVAARYLVGIKSPGVCNGQYECGASSPCPLGQACVFESFNRDQCRIDSTIGVCWGLPDTCPPTPRASQCTGRYTGTVCDPLCQAMKNARDDIAEYALDPVLCSD